MQNEEKLAGTSIEDDIRKNSQTTFTFSADRKMCSIQDQEEDR
jgi:hypothetical protein